MSSLAGNKNNIQVLRGLSTNNSLLSCTADGTKVDLYNTDDGSGRQEWNIVQVIGQPEGIYNIIVSGGVTSDKKYLSCTEDGSKVDLYTKDDGSGRQRWTFTPVSQPNNPIIPSYYNIKIVGGTNNGRVYLSCIPDGTKVDLYNTDDGSGRQRWQLQ